MAKTIPNLTAREDQICALLARGNSNREIADELQMASATVKVHVSRIFLKTGCHSRTAVAVLYVQGASAKPTRANHPPAPPTGGKGRKKR